MLLLHFLFWFCAAWLGWVFFGYPLAMALLAWLRGRAVKSVPQTPSISILVAAHNEAEHIGDTLRNKLAQDYPDDKLEIIVVSDGSEDGTDAAVEALADPRVRLMRQQPRQGKTAALNMAAATATGELLVFSDANSLYEPGALRALAACFADPSVGYVTGRMIYGNPDGSVVGDGCTGYMRYENKLREWETLAGSVVGVDGGIDAVRRELYVPMRADQLPDFVLPLAVVEQGYRKVYEPRAVLKELALSDDGQEFRMRVRVSLRALWALWDKRALLNPFRYRLFSLQLWSHKVLRYLAFIPIALLLPLNLALLGSGAIYTVALAAQGAFWCLALLGARPGAGRVTGWPYYFGMLNWASAVAFLRFLRGEKQVTWQPRGGA
jgi:cellulose synthase/poly-beta-1,6-N-acetylglucosamine synthase-like glycosyltransferase